MRYAALGIATVLCVACTSASKKQTDFDWSANEIALTHQLMKPDTILGSFTGMIVADSTLIISCIDTDPICTRFTIRGDNLLVREHFLRKGHGPAEALWYADLQYFPADTSFLLFGYLNGDNYRFRFPLHDTALIRQPSRWNRQPVTGNDQGSFCQLLFANHHDYIAQRLDENDEMFWYATPDTLLPLGIPYPDDGQKAGGIAKATIYMGMLAKHPTESKFLYTTRNSGKYAFIFTVDTVSHSVTDRVSLLDEYPVYEVRPDGLNAVAKPDSPRPVRCAVSKDYIYMLYVGGTFERPEAGGTYSDLVRVYDWEGNPIRSFRLDQLVDGLYTDADGHYLYGIATDKESFEPRLLRYRLLE